MNQDNGSTRVLDPEADWGQARKWFTHWYGGELDNTEEAKTWFFARFGIDWRTQDPPGTLTFYVSPYQISSTWFKTQPTQNWRFNNPAIRFNRLPSIEEAPEAEATE